MKSPTSTNTVNEKEGNKGHRPINKNEPVFETLEDLAPPDYLRPLAAEYWTYFVQRLVEKRVLSTVDGQNLALYCSNYADFVEAERHIAQHGVMMPNAQKNQALNVKKDACATMIKVGSVLGLDPVSRSRVVVPKAKGQSELAKVLSMANKTPPKAPKNRSE